MPTPEQAPTSAFAALPIKQGLQPRLPSETYHHLAPAPPLPEPLLLPAPPRYHLGHALRHSGLLGLPPIVCGPDEAVPTLQVVLYPAAVGFHAPGTPAAIEALVVQPSPLGDQPLLVYGLRPSPWPDARADAPTDALTDALLEQLRLMLRLDEDLGVFYRLADQDPELAWVTACDGGRLLRAPTAFEDLVHCLVGAYGPPARVAGLVQRLCEQLGPRTSLGRRGFPGPAAIAEAPLRVYEQLIAPWPGGTVASRTGRGLGRALRELAILCASGSLHPESLRRRPTQLTRALDLDDDRDDGVWQDTLHEELEWQERVRSLLESLPGFRSPTVGSRAVEEMLLRLGCYDGLRLDNLARAAWERRFPLPATRRPARPADPQLQRRLGRHPSPAALALSGRATPATATPSAPSAQTPAEQKAERHAHGLTIARRIARRVAPFSIYRGLAQALLLRVPPSPQQQRQ